MHAIQPIFEQAIRDHRAGNLAAAESLYRQVLEAHPGQLDALYLLGTALLQLKRFDESIEILARVADERPDVPDARNNLGVAYKALGQWEDAARAFETTLRAHPEYQQAYFNLGALMADRSLLADAEKCFRRSLELNPGDKESRHRLGLVLQAQRNWTEAEACYRELLARDAPNLDILVNLGFVLANQERLDEAVAVYQRILSAQPNYHEVHNNLAYISERQGRFQDAIDAARRAVEIRPEYAEGYNNWGTALRSLHRLDEACDCFQKSLDLQQDFALAEFNLATTRMLQGRLRDGWQGYERRVEAAGLTVRQFSQRRWDGTAIAGRRLLVHSDQGFGDALQFVRFLKRAQRQSGAQVILECQPELMTLLHGQAGADELISSDGPATHFDFQIPLSSLPGLFEIDRDGIPSDVPYLPTNVPLRPELNKLVNESAAAGLKVGIVWRGNPEQARDSVRSCPFDKFLRLAETTSVSCFSLQTGVVGLEELKSLRTERVVDLGSHFRDFADTAAAILAMDLVITVDTAVAHLAGALGSPVWTLLPYTPDWRWFLNRNDSPWYPSMRLFRQPSWGDWDAVLERVWSDLK